jgi:hypothetical protein
VKGLLAPDQSAIFAGLVSTASVPTIADLINAVGRVTDGPGGDELALSPQSSGLFDISSLKGTTVRFAILNVAAGSGGELLALDNVRLLVTFPTPPTTVPTLSAWGLAALGALLAGTGYLALRPRRA